LESDGTLTAMLSKLPMVLGHEVAGMVSAIGPEVNTVGVGDRVVILGPERSTLPVGQQTVGSPTRWLPWPRA
jgi:NADPH:quinone reductase-like Zn-dependent oxidoreductase